MTLNQVIADMRAACQRKMDRAWEACQVSGAPVAREKIQAPLHLLDVAEQALLDSREEFARRHIEAAERLIYNERCAYWSAR